MGKSQSSQAHQSMQNDLAHRTESARVLIDGCSVSSDRKTSYVYACFGLYFDDNSSCRQSEELRFSQMKASAFMIAAQSTIADR